MKRVGMRERREIHSRRPPGGVRRAGSESRVTGNTTHQTILTLPYGIGCIVRCVHAYVLNSLHVIDMLRGRWAVKLKRQTRTYRLPTRPSATVNVPINNTTPVAADGKAQKLFKLSLGKATPRRSNFIPFPLSFRQLLFAFPLQGSARAPLSAIE